MGYCTFPRGKERIIHDKDYQITEPSEIEVGKFYREMKNNEEGQEIKIMEKPKENGSVKVEMRTRKKKYQLKINLSDLGVVPNEYGNWEHVYWLKKI